MSSEELKISSTSSLMIVLKLMIGPDGSDEHSTKNTRTRLDVLTIPN
jgi:hypothetical protein